MKNDSTPQADGGGGGANYDITLKTFNKMFISNNNIWYCYMCITNNLHFTTLTNQNFSKLYSYQSKLQLRVQETTKSGLYSTCCSVQKRLAHVQTVSV